MIARACSSSTEISALGRHLSRLACRVLENDKRLGPESFECFNQDYLAFRLALERYFGAHFVDLVDLYAGAWVGEEAGGVRVALNGAPVGGTFTLTQRFPSTRQDLELGTVYRNAPGAPFDLVCLLPTGKEEDNVMIAYECRHARRIPSHADKVDMMEIDTAVTKVQDVYSGDMPPFVLVFMSNRLFSSEASTKNQGKLSEALQVGGSWSRAIVVVRENCIDYFGASLARRFMGYMESGEVSSSN